ncbi:MAG: aryl-sulfate sulfotransferase [Deltaproteobacteria bacterium]|nr:aryl-sulfate sulfotransferase [Deltaproteobacteria bacterium]
MKKSSLFHICFIIFISACIISFTAQNGVAGSDRSGDKGGGKRGGGGRKTEFVPTFSRTSEVAPGQAIADISKKPANIKLGVVKHDTKKTFKGYTLFAPKHWLTTHLIDMEGREINSWKSDYEPGQSVYLLKNGNLLHCCMTKNQDFIGGGEGGRIEEYNWEGDMVWSLWYSDSTKLAHHDIEPMPNGNILMMVVEKKTPEDMIAAGFSSSTSGRQGRGDGSLFAEYIVEIERFGSKGYNEVWEWHIWDHLVQDNDPSKANYGVVADHPGRLTASAGRGGFWNHGNSIDYNPKLDQIILSARGQSELWVIDHSTTTEEAKGRTGGKYGKGGDLLYRWGNPAMYGAGTRDDQKLFLQHDPHWILPGCPGEGNILIYNNGKGRGYSTVEEIVPPVDKNGFYPKLKPGEAYEPKEQHWVFTTEPKSKMYSTEISGAQRLPNGNTLVCAGTYGRFMEVTPDKEIVWEYAAPFDGNGPLKQGDPVLLDVRGHQMNAVFKVHRYAPDYPAFKGRDMTPGESLVRK